MESYSKTRLFLISFATAFFFIALLFLFLVAVIHPGTPSGLQADVPTEEVYLPNEEDALTLLLIGTETHDSAAGTFLLMHFDPVGEQVLVTALPPETVLEHDGKTETLFDAYRYGGVRYTVAALKSCFAMPIDRYARITLNSFILSANAVGTVEFVFKEDITLVEGNVPVTYHQGTQLLDGRKVAALIRHAGFSPEERCDITMELVCAVIDQRLDVVRSTLLDKIFETVINLVDTDISYADYEKRKKSAIQMSYSETPIAHAIKLSGRWEGDCFYLYDTSLALLAQNYL